ncbi:hypothetical protein QE152_g24563 [Popillia japonica]|uniref:Zinc finger PHD-type domain-containing protein n=1 Tax=Popillia japonica TaxID=7064 RepID=A0AAW1KGB0_POPJA
MPKCVVCAQNVSRYDDTIMCSSSSCAKQFHTKCVDISEESLVELKTSGNIRKWTCNSYDSITNLTKSSAKNDPSINFTSFSGACGFDIDAFITVKIKHAINLITQEVINVLKSEIAKLNMNNCHLADEVNKLRNEVNNLNNENSILKNELQLFSGRSIKLRNEVNNLNNENSILKNELQLFIRKRLEDGSSHSHANKINNINNPDQKAK